MKVNLNNNTFYVEFRHVHPEISTGHVKLSAKKSITPAGELLNHGDAGTYCIVKEDNRDGTIITQAQAILHKADANSFNKSKGRKASLTKALKSMMPGRSFKEDRRVFWETYFKTCK